VDTAPFWDGCAGGQLLLQRCDGCGLHRFPPAPLCPRCWSRESTWVASSGRARLRSTVVFHQQYHPAFPVPYTVGLVELEEGPTLYAPVHADAGTDLLVGTPLVLEWEPIGQTALPRFRATPAI